MNPKCFIVPIDSWAISLPPSEQYICRGPDGVGSYDVLRRDRSHRVFWSVELLVARQRPSKGDQRYRLLDYVANRFNISNLPLSVRSPLHGHLGLDILMFE